MVQFTLQMVHECNYAVSWGVYASGCQDHGGDSNNACSSEYCCRDGVCKTLMTTSIVLNFVLWLVCHIYYECCF